MSGWQIRDKHGSRTGSRGFTPVRSGRPRGLRHGPTYIQDNYVGPWLQALTQKAIIGDGMRAGHLPSQHRDHSSGQWAEHFTFHASRSVWMGAAGKRHRSEMTLRFRRQRWHYGSEVRDDTTVQRSEMTLRFRGLRWHHGSEVSDDTTVQRSEMALQFRGQRWHYPFRSQNWHSWVQRWHGSEVRDDTAVQRSEMTLRFRSQKWQFGADMTGLRGQRWHSWEHRWQDSEVILRFGSQRWPAWQQRWQGSEVIYGNTI